MSGKRKSRRPPLEPIGPWTPGEFYSICIHSPQLDYGRIWRGVAVRKIWNASPKGRRPPMWGMYHCGSGHRICLIEAHETEAFKIADQVAALTDWSFDGLDGWKNTDPQLRERLVALVDRIGKPIKLGSGGRSHEGAQAVAYARAS